MQEISLTASDGAAVACYHWASQQPKAVIQIAHGMGEHGRRYDWVAGQLSAAGFEVRANDHRGHGKTGAANLGWFGPDGWNRVLADAFEINRDLRKNYPDLPLILLGHSMGSMLSQQYITRYGASIDALVLSGSPGFKAPSRNPIPGWILAFETRRHGPDACSPLMQNLLFGNSNKPFDGPDATGFEWLSRDADEVAKYVADDECGFVVANGSLKDLYAGAALASKEALVAGIPKALPTYVFAGSDDPVHGEKQDIERMVQAYRNAGMANVTLKWYEQGRHEMFNEVNKTEVVADLIAWLDQQI